MNKWQKSILGLAAGLGAAALSLPTITLYRDVNGVGLTLAQVLGAVAAILTAWAARAPGHKHVKKPTIEDPKKEG